VQRDPRGAFDDEPSRVRCAVSLKRSAKRGGLARSLPRNDGRVTPDPRPKKVFADQPTFAPRSRNTERM
jgi:hypothetical protein